MKTLIVNRNLIVPIFAVMLLIYGLQGISYAQNAPNDAIVEFADANLATAIREELGLDTGEGVDILKIPKAELAKLTKLYANDIGIVDFTGLEHATQLTILSLNRNNISDLTPLTQLTQLRQLRTLRLSDNNISDLTSLTQLTFLEDLDLSDNNISDLTPLAEMIQLGHLILASNLIIDVTPLAQLINLDFLLLSSNYINDLTPLAQLPERTSKSAVYNPVNFRGTPSDIELITVSTAQPLVGSTLNGSSVTLTLLPSGTSFDASADNIRNALTVSGVDGATVSDVIRVSDTEVKVTLAFTGSLQDNAVLSFILEKDVVSGYEGRALTGNHIPVYAKAPLTVSANYPLKAAMLDGSVVTLTLNSGTFNHSLVDFRDALTISGIDGIAFYDSIDSIYRVSETQRRITLRFKGNVDADTVLTFTLDAKAIEYYNGPPFTAELPVTATVKELQVLIPELQGQPMFWVNTGTGKIESSGHFDVVTQGVTVLTVDRAGGKLYWGERSKNGGIIKRANFDGTSVEVLLTLPNVPRGIAIDTVESKLYWTNSDLQIQTSDLNGEGISTVIQLEENILEETKENCRSGGFFFFLFVPLILGADGGGCDIETIRTNLTSPTDITVNTVDGRVYWTEFSGRIRRMNLDGTGLDTLVPDIGSPYGIVVAGDKVYWAEEVDERHGKIQWANFNGTNIETLATVQGLPTGISVDTAAGKVYWTNSLLGEIQRTDINGGEVEDVALGITAPGDFVLVPDPQQMPPTTAATTDATVSISPASVASPAIGQQLEFSLNIADGGAVAAYQATVQFDGTALRYISSTIGDYLPVGAFPLPVDASGNTVTLGAVSLAGESNGDGTLATITFEVIEVKKSTVTLSDVLLSDSAETASSPQVEDAQIIEPPQVNEDVNRDGDVNILDLVRVAGQLGQSGQNSADVNGDGIVNILDLVAVAGALGNAAAAPSSWYRDLEIAPTRADVGEWLAQAQGLDLTDATSQRGVLFLEQLLAVLTPKETMLLPNYPNPFNPETWIPYHLAREAEVVITIYDTKGTLVRRLTLGNQWAGHYAERGKAAYWDGRNERGETVASGIYIYQLRAGDYAASRRMVIVK